MATKTRCLVTGGAGYLGAVMCGRLLEAGHAVTVVDSLLYGQTSLVGYCNHPDFSFARGDVRDEPLMKSLVAEADVLIPLAALVGAPACEKDPWFAESVNFGAIELLNRVRSREQLVVYPVTNSGYGTQSGEVHCTEDTPLEPISLYGQTKVRAEAELLSSENAITLRLATVFGPSPRLRLDLLVNHFTYAALTDGYIVLFEKQFKRNFVHVADVADGFLHAIENADTMSGKPYNLGLDAANMSKEELAQKVKEQVPSFVIMESNLQSDPDKRNYIVSNQRLREAGFEASRSIECGIRQLITAYRMLPVSAFKNVQDVR